MTPEQLHRVIVTVADAVIDHADELTALDQAIGDGDHGLNMKRGFDAVRADAALLAAKPLPEALGAIGLQLVMKIGGASGPLYGTLLMAMGKAISPDGANIAAAFAGGVAAVKARGKSQPGQKTMLDVLVPIEAALSAGAPDLPHRLPAIAQAAAEATVPMEATRGRASFLGARSIGHMDPGACSSALITAAVCRALGD
ncbi:dihydroxyacetone kinase subunit L [Aliidongia dinghuensis]|uniref:Dihydroxyacetone kinase subunit L n=1 Tax=Aliidongia dinghuensis TaxID=1867774 RepID=A0A8J2YZQ3_9PROT|nr:dihydroxyacetone kinase subunit DhaL [Aliidongia dinghuensis]GGF47469.1 dihydroxyacetone kinase subunit L [Aliidongia dinghuensis]